MPAINQKFDVTLAGDCNLDLILYGLPDNLAPERELLATTMAQSLGGSAAITAHNLAALGNSVGFICASANDPNDPNNPNNPNDAFSAFCQQALHTAGVDTSRAVPTPNCTTGVSVLLQHSAYRRTLTYPGATHQLSLGDLDISYLAQAPHFHMSSYYLQTALTKDIPTLFAQLKQQGMTISLDPNDDPSNKWDRSILEALQYVDILLPNEREACRIAHTSSLTRAVAQLRELVPHLIVKQGTAGATAYTQFESHHAQPYPVQSIDAIGAGDSFNAGFLHGYLRKWPLTHSLKLASLTAAWSTTFSGGTKAFSDPRSREAFAMKCLEYVHADREDLDETAIRSHRL